jgi:hypothetical protein
MQQKPEYAYRDAASTVTKVTGRIAGQATPGAADGAAGRQNDDFSVTDISLLPPTPVLHSGRRLQGVTATHEREMTMSNARLRSIALVGLLFAGASGAAMAAQPAATGLGQAWPNTTDVSANPNWHAYVFVLGGIKYVQVNDANGNVIGAVGTSNGQFITLPIGRFAQLVSTPQQPAAVDTGSQPTTAPATVYQDDSVQVTATPQTDGTVRLMAASTCDPIQCNNRIN